MNNTVNYWFTIEPYVFVNVTKQGALLYNTLDKAIVESDKIEIIKLLMELMQENNCGVILLTENQYKSDDINDFISELREKYMGDIIDVSLSKGKPVQLLPYFNFSDKLDVYKKHNFSSLKNVCNNLSEINLYIDSRVDILKLISFVKSIPGSPMFNIIGDIEKVSNYKELLFDFKHVASPKNIICSYKDLMDIHSGIENGFSYRIIVDFPIDMRKFNSIRWILLDQTLPVEYVFNVLSDNDCLDAEQIIKQYNVEKYKLIPIYTGKNLDFFEDNVFLTRDDILSTSMTIKDFFIRKAMNIYDFGKINIKPNGDAYANFNHSILGNIYRDNINEIVQKEVDEGESWFRIRNQVPCNDCIYQWLCPSPSDYEIVIGRPNLCHVKN